MDDTFNEMNYIVLLFLDLCVGFISQATQQRLGHNTQEATNR